MSRDDPLAKAACRRHDADLWFPAYGDNNTRDRAQRICSTCPIRQLCADLGADEEYGIWGGTTPTERNRGDYARRR